MTTNRSVRRWTKPRGDPEGKKRIDVFAMEAVFFPINIGNQHWTLCYALPQEKRIVYLDSMGASGRKILKTIFTYFKEEHKDKKGCELPDQDKWFLDSPGATAPQQRNGSDCGVFASTFIDYIAMVRHSFMRCTVPSMLPHSGSSIVSFETFSTETVGEGHQRRVALPKEHATDPAQDGAQYFKGKD